MNDLEGIAIDLSETPPPDGNGAENGLESKAKKIAKEVFDHFSKVATSATDEMKYLKAHKGADLYGKAQNIAWMFEYGETNSDEMIADLETDDQTMRLRKDLLALNKIKQELDKLPPKARFAKIGLKRIRDDHQRTIGYWVLAIYPEESFVTHIGLDKKAGTNENEDIGGHAIFYKPSTACMNHACDDLYRSLPQGAGYLPCMELGVALQGLQGTGEKLEYMIEKDGDEKITQDTACYLTVALLGGMSNETERIRISDLWKRIGKKF